VGLTGQATLHKPDANHQKIAIQARDVCDRVSDLICKMHDFPLTLLQTATLRPFLQDCQRMEIRGNALTIKSLPSTCEDGTSSA
jgi:hypothetical protein